jgi:ParB family transcriptional regulator, chromosome partitioning protein
MAKPQKSSKSISRPGETRPTTGLGRGLSDIITQGARSFNATPVAVAGPSIRQLLLSQIVANPRQPRVRFIEEPLDELVASIKEHGILQPITVRPRDHQFEIIAGERRFRACQKAGLSNIPAIVKTVSDLEAYELALIENLQRENLDPIEEARGYRRLVVDFSLTQEQISQKVGKNRATIANAMRLLDLPEEIQSYLAQNRISQGHAKVILSLENSEQQIKLAEEIIRQSLSVRQTEAWISRWRLGSGDKTKSSRSKIPHETPAHLRAIQESLQQKLAMRVHIQPSGNGGRVEIHYYTASDLDRLLELLNVQV